MEKNALHIAQSLTSAFAQRDADGFDRLYADDAVIWHGSTNKTQSKDENVAFLRRVFALMSQIGYEEITRFPTTVGFVQSHVIRGTFVDGKKIPELHACLVVTVHDGKIVRLNEWFDSAQFQEVWERLDGKLQR